MSACETCSRALHSFADAAAMKSLVFWDDVCRFGEPGGLLETSVCKLEASEPWKKDELDLEDDKEVEERLCAREELSEDEDKLDIMVSCSKCG